MTSLIKSLDFFATPFNLTVLNKEKYKTVLGGSLTLLASFVMILIFFLFGSDFIHKKNPKTNTIMEQKGAEEVRYVQVNNKNFTVMWKIEDVDALPISPGNTVFQPAFEYIIYKKDANNSWITHKQVYPKPKRCVDTSAKENELIQNYNLEEWNCIDWDEISIEIGEPAYIGGLWSNDHVVELRLNFHNCYFDYGKAKFSLDNCSSYKEISDILNNQVQFFSFVLPDYNFDTTNYSSPIKTVYKYEYYKANANISLTEYFYFSFVTLRDDKGWIFEDILIENAVEMLYKKNLILLVKEEDFEKNPNQRYFQLIPFFTNEERVHFRSFVKIQEILANIGGILKIVILLFDSVSGFFTSRMRKFMLFSYISKPSTNIPVGNSSNLSRIGLSRSFRSKNISETGLFLTVIRNTLCCASSLVKLEQKKVKKELEQLDAIRLLQLSEKKEQSREQSRVSQRSQFFKKT